MSLVRLPSSPGGRQKPFCHFPGVKQLLNTQVCMRYYFHTYFGRTLLCCHYYMTFIIRAKHFRCHKLVPLILLFLNSHRPGGVAEWTVWLVWVANFPIFHNCNDCDRTLSCHISVRAKNSWILDWRHILHLPSPVFVLVLSMQQPSIQLQGKPDFRTTNKFAQK